MQQLLLALSLMSTGAQEVNVPKGSMLCRHPPAQILKEDSDDYQQAMDWKLCEVTSIDKQALLIEQTPDYRTIQLFRKRSYSTPTRLYWVSHKEERP